MIWRKDFEKISNLIEISVSELFIEAEKSSDYILFLARGDYIDKFVNTIVNPYTIDNKYDILKDEALMKVLLSFLNNSYSFSSENTCDSKESIFYETMLYLNIWESRPYLKLLKRITNLLSNNEYLWKLNISDRTKSVFLEQQILPELKKRKLKIYDVIKIGYRKQLRDAIAHNEYWHNWAKPELIFENYKLNPNREDKLHYNEWTEIFVYTFLLAYHFRNYLGLQKKKLDDIKCIEGFKVKLMNAKERKVDGLVFYNKEKNKFNSRIR